MYESIPASLEKVYRAKPVYEVLDGWDEDISTVRSYEELPENCKKYLKRIEELAKTRISIVSVGPDRTHNIYINDIISK